jgi:hypothetical protein
LGLPAFLLPETTIHANGASPVLDLGDSPAPLLLTLGILDVVEQESLLLGIHGSADAATWLPEPLTGFPEKFYPGVSAVYLDPTPHAIRFIRAEWKVNRWGRGSKTPSYRLYLFAEPLDPPRAG